MRTKMGAAAALLTVAALTGCGGSTAAAPTPTPTGTTPASCLRALDLAARASDMGARAIIAASEQDSATLDQMTKDLNANAHEFTIARADCRAGR